MNIQEDLEEIALNEHEEHKEPKYKKILIKVGSVLLSLLMISYIFVTFPIGDLVASLSESDELSGNIIDTGDFLIVLESNTRERLIHSYFNEQEKEFSVCLSGEKRGDDYYIDDLYFPKMYTQTFNHVTFESCTKDTIMMLHTHPYKSCIASDTDINTLRKSQVNNPDMLMVVMCEQNRFSVYN